MSEPRPTSRIEEALTASEPGFALCILAKELRDEGMTQAELYNLFDEFRAQHSSDAEGFLCDAILDTMDVIGGFCNPAEALFPEVA